MSPITNFDAPNYALLIISLASSYQMIGFKNIFDMFKEVLFTSIAFQNKSIYCFGRS